MMINANNRYSLAVIPWDFLDKRTKESDEFLESNGLTYRGVVEFACVIIQEDLRLKENQHTCDILSLIMDVGAVELAAVTEVEDHKDLETKAIKLANIVYTYVLSIYEFLESIPENVEWVYLYGWFGDKPVFGIRK